MYDDYSNLQCKVSQRCVCVCVYRCWERNVNMGFWWIIRSPILFAYLVSLSLYVCLIPSV